MPTIIIIRDQHFEDITASVQAEIIDRTVRQFIFLASHSIQNELSEGKEALHFMRPWCLKSFLSMHTYLCTCNVFGTLEGNTSPGQSHSLTLEVR